MSAVKLTYRVTEPALSKHEREVVEIIHTSGMRPGAVDRWTLLRSDLTRIQQKITIEKMLETRVLQQHPTMPEYYRVNLSGWTTNLPGRTALARGQDK